MYFRSSLKCSRLLLISVTYDERPISPISIFFISPLWQGCHLATADIPLRWAILTLQEVVVDLPGALAEQEVLAVDGKIERTVDDSESVIDNDEIFHPIFIINCKSTPELVTREDQLAQVTDHKENDDANEHNGYTFVPLLLVSPNH